MIPVHVYRAQETVPGKEVPAVTIHITEPMPDLPPERSQVLFAADGKAMAEAIWGSCPGGTVDALIVALLTRRASLLRVTMPAADTEAAP